MRTKAPRRKAVGVFLCTSQEELERVYLLDPGKIVKKPGASKSRKVESRNEGATRFAY
jgi:hypothetical protein